MGTKKRICCLVNIMERNYANYNAVQFAADSYFLQWQMVGDEESCEFWETFRKTYPGKEKDIESAIRIVKSIQLNDVRFLREEMDLEKKRIQRSINRKNGFKKKGLWAVSVAASFLVLVAGYFLILQNFPTVSNFAEEQTQYQSKENKNIVLTLPGDSVIAFDENTEVIIDEQGSLTVSGNNQKALFASKVQSPEKETELKMNKLVVPWGKRSSLVLADGSKIWINSGSILEFPSVFSISQRLIRVEGEIFIEVAKNDTKPFTVRTEKFDVIVTGTTFNVTAYNDETTQRVVLVEGSVKIDIENKPTMNLEPNDKFSLTGNQAEKQKVDVYDYISWKDGIYRFAGESLENILKRLSRYYDVSFVCDDNVKSMQLRGKLALMDDFTSVLDNIEVIVPIKYEIENDKILISKK